MEKKIFTLLLFAFFGVYLAGQSPTGVIKKASVAPVIDGTIEAVWDEANVYDIDKPYRAETPTIDNGGITTWRGLYTDDGIFILVDVKDDVFSPAYAGLVPGNNWEYDKPEVYFDVNAELIDGKGAGTNGNGNGSGHYQFAPQPIEGEIDGGVLSVEGSNDAEYSYKVDDPAYVVEYFIPFSKLLDGNGDEVDKTRKIGFDVTVIDNDVLENVRNRAVWANIGTFDESWSNMDECGTITLDGLYVSSTMATSVSITSAGDASTIETDEGTLQMSATVLPEDAANKSVKWTVTDGTGTAFIDNNGLLYALTNGTVTVTATTKDGSFKTASKDITLSRQSINMGDISLVKNGDFRGEGPVSPPWIGAAIVTDGVAVCDPPVAGANPWDWVLRQVVDAESDIPYIFTFNAYTDYDRTFNVDFEDPNNSYTRYGVSDDPESNGTSDWTFTVTTEPTTYVFHVTFTQIKENTIQSMQFMLGNADDAVYLDSVYLVAVEDLDKLTPLKVPQNYLNSVQIFPNPVVDELNVSVLKANSLITIYNSLGRKQAEYKVKGHFTKIDVSNYANGLYFLKVNDDTVVKFIK